MHPHGGWWIVFDGDVHGTPPQMPSSWSALWHILPSHSSDIENAIFDIVSFLAFVAWSRVFSANMAATWNNFLTFHIGSVSISGSQPRCPFALSSGKVDIGGKGISYELKKGGKRSNGLWKSVVCSRPVSQVARWAVFILQLTRVNIVSRWKEVLSMPGGPDKSPGLMRGWNSWSRALMILDDQYKENNADW